MIPPSLLGLLSAGRAVFAATREDLLNPPWDEARGRVLVARLSPFRDVDRSSAHLILFSETRAALPASFIDFAFMPDHLDRELLSSRGLPWFFGAASGHSPADFDLILVSNAFGLELINLPRLFSTAGLPLRASARAALPGPLPLVILGGSNAGQCGALVDMAGEAGRPADSLIDGIFFGEGEGAIGPLSAILADATRSRGERLDAASAIAGFWPALRPGKKARRRILRESPPPLLAWPLFDSPVAGTTRLQVTAGCPGYCSFCFEGWDRRPYRELPMEAVLAAAREMRERNGSDTLEVYSFNFNTHEDIVPLLYELGRIFRNVNFMSQRLDILARSEGLMAAELAADKRSFTLGIEGISSRMRAWYRKGLEEDDLTRLLSLLIVPGVRELKLFYILSGFETGEDVAEFAAFIAKLADLRASRAPGLRVLVSAGYLVRLPGTPLRHAPLVLDEAVFRGIAEALEAACTARSIEWRLAVHFDEYYVDQLVSLAGGILLPWLEGLSRLDVHAVYDDSLSRTIGKSLEGFAARRGLLTDNFLGEKDEKNAPVLPFLDEGSSSGVLWKEYLEARSFIDRKPCLGGRCSDCGACDEPASRVFMTRHKHLAASRSDRERLARLIATKRAFARVLVTVDRPETIAGASAPAQEAWLLRRLATAAPETWQGVYSAKLLFPAPDGDFGIPEGAFGLSVFALEGPARGALESLAGEAGFEVLPEMPRPSTLDVCAHIPPDLNQSARAVGKRLSREGDAPACLVADWLGRSRVSFVERREAGTRHFEVARRDLARKIAYQAKSGKDTIVLQLGVKAKLDDLGSDLGPRVAALVAPRVLGWS